MTENTTLRDLARIGVAMEEQDGELFRVTLHSLGSFLELGFGSDVHTEMVEGQIYAASNGTTEQTEQYVRTFMHVFDIETMSDVNDLLGREKHITENYKGQLAFVQ